VCALACAALAGNVVVAGFVHALADAAQALR
jgi:hypothetical protein